MYGSISNTRKNNDPFVLPIFSTLPRAFSSIPREKLGWRIVRYVL